MVMLLGMDDIGKLRRNDPQSVLVSLLLVQFTPTEAFRVKGAPGNDTPSTVILLIVYCNLAGAAPVGVWPP